MKCIFYGLLLLSMVGGRAFGAAAKSAQDDSAKGKIVAMQEEAKFFFSIQFSGGALKESKSVFPAVTFLNNMRSINLEVDIALNAPSSCDNYLSSQESLKSIDTLVTKAQGVYKNDNLNTSSINVVFTEVYGCNGKRVYPVQFTHDFGIATKVNFKTIEKYLVDMTHSCNGAIQALADMKNDEEDAKKAQARIKKR